jgi:LmbE family N-acetylglucosaminyl deacetylase
MKALVLVAHPDDCVIFASAYMDAHPEHEWTIKYLTHWRLHKRGREMSRYWRKRGIKTRYLGFKDHGRDLGLKGLHTWSEEEALRALRREAVGYDLILTHGEAGEYGHPHHKVVHKAVKNFTVRKVYFSLDTNDLALPITIALEELPRHAESIRIHAGTGVAYYKEQL